MLPIRAVRTVSCASSEDRRYCECMYLLQRAREDAGALTILYVHTYIATVGIIITNCDLVRLSPKEFSLCACFLMSSPLFFY